MAIEITGTAPIAFTSAPFGTSVPAAAADTPGAEPVTVTAAAAGCRIVGVMIDGVPPVTVIVAGIGAVDTAPARTTAAVAQDEDALRVAPNRGQEVESLIARPVVPNMAPLELFPR
jgi:hypothetical protein